MSELYKLPDGWKWEILDNLTEINIGKTPSRSKSYYFLGNKVWLSIRDLKGDYVSESNEKITDEAIKNTNLKLIKKGTLLMSFKLTLGRTSFADCDLYTNEAIASLPIKDESILDKYFLKYSLGVIDLEKEVDNAVKGKTLNKKKIKNLDIPLPPLLEQQRIVSKLDKLFEKIDKGVALHQKNMDEADLFMGSVLNDVFGELEEKYDVKTLGNLTKTTSGGTPKRNEKSYWGGNIGWLKSGELNDGYIQEVEEFITVDGLNKSSAKLFPIGTLLIAMYGSTVGRLGILEIETSTNQAICGILNDKNQFETMYMFYFLKKIREKMLKDSFGGAQPNISQTYIKELELPLPPLNIQQKAVKYLDEISEKIEKLKQVQKEKMESLIALKASILDKAFRGEL